MKVRYPKMDFSKIRPHWAPHIEFVQRANASSTIPSYVEPYLVKVMLKAKAVLDPRETELHRGLAIFIKQEAQHCKQHNAFNERLRSSGYPELADHEAKLDADLTRFLETKSLKFNLAYADGFEAMGALGATMWFDAYNKYLEGADQDAVDLWRWHMAEEYEHREVAFKIYQKLYGKNDLLNGWLYRAYGFLFAIVHLIGYGKRVGAYLLGKDRERMSAAEREASIAREKEFAKTTGKKAIPELLKVLSPTYNPANTRAPEGVGPYLTQYETEPT
ncbi:metal-dependent hydrolase [Terricaulis silvestris]|uniref:Putative metal-dependent hydrolase n=1 Tax=Terricaulis silvestris TaxID=2686094 RepID=A0A6I6MRW3_9CAUL|nr:metal-dependent hydrolase [Terricaulis silvestris]QGZ96156.1 putative metal-dependent hydrolase [Terricaulis silvestris]